MIIDPYKYLRTGKFFEHAMLHAVTAAGHDHVRSLEKIEEGEDKGKFKPFEMTLTIGEKEVDITSFFDHIEKEFERCVKKEANELMKEKYNDKLRIVYGNVQVIEDFLKKQIENLIPEEER